MREILDNGMQSDGGIYYRMKQKRKLLNSCNLKLSTEPKQHSADDYFLYE